MDTPEPHNAEIERLFPGLGGQWEVRTRGSSHIWNLDQQTYMRQPLPSSTPMDYDNVEVCVTKVELWPAVGGRSCVWFDSPDDPLMEQWRVSGKVLSIRCLDCDESTAERVD